MAPKKNKTEQEPELAETPIEPAVDETADVEKAETAAEAESSPEEVEVIEGEAVLDEEEDQAAAEIQTLKEELAQVQAKAAEYLDGWQRAQAEFANYKKRITREQEQNRQMATANAIRHCLDIFDDFDRAIKNRPQSGEAAGWAEGVELIYRKFLNYLDNEGVEMIDAEGAPFDPNLHEAISQEDHPDFESGMVIGVVQQGYRLGDRVLRAARVRVAR